QHQLSPQIPQGAAHLILTLEPVEGLRVMGPLANPQTMMVANTRPVLPLDVLAGQMSYPDLSEIFDKMSRLCRRVWTVEATRIALDLGSPVLANIVLLGAAGAAELLPFDRNGLEKVLQGRLGPEKTALNLEAFDRGGQAVQSRQTDGLKP
ncbi:MAG: 2-oxoacid:acceptor oxidoreductase family protein, partial [Deltaproteobacteria bacterium]|nr:2-oxoacid:acceptor oxidoreductase family protein [Deltaproteobacteria bacterium]